MTVEHIEVLVEEPSAEAALRILLPRVLHATSFDIYAHSCKDDLVKSLPSRLRGYAKWLPRDWRIVVLVDRDDDDCRTIKTRLDGIATSEGLVTKSTAVRGRFSVVNRLAIEELEAWFFGDWEAVQKAYPRVDANVPLQSKYRYPDRIKGGTWEALERIMQSAGYFRTGIRKIELARAVATHMDPRRNTSPSFRALQVALTNMAI